MAEGGRKRRKFASVSLQAELYVLHDKEHKVRSQEFDAWNDQVLKILDRAEKDIGVETNKFISSCRRIRDWDWGCKLQWILK